MGKSRAFTAFHKAVSVLSCLILMTTGSSVPSADAEYRAAEPSVIEETLSPTPTQVPTPVLEPTPTPDFFTISMIGDCTPASDHYSKNTASGYERVVGDDWAYPFAKTVHLLDTDDLTIANLECTLTVNGTPSDRLFNFRAPPEAVNILKYGSVEFASLGNNHVIDYGDIGYQDTKDVLTEAGIGFAGRDEWSLYTTERGLVVGVYANSFGQTNAITAGVTALKEAGAELIIAALHWGVEGSYNATGAQRSQARAAVDAGAHIVMGTHPHALQEFEEYNGGYIYYCLGNWTFGGNTNPRDKDTVLVRLRIMRDTDGTISIVAREHIPCSVSGRANGNDYQPAPYEPGSEEYLRVLSKLDGSYIDRNPWGGYAVEGE